MNPQDLKQGQSYLILANYYGNDCDNDHHFIAVPSKSRFYLDERAVRQCVSLPSEPPTSAGSPSKYSPLRRFRKGDKVRVVSWQGRSPGCSALLGKITTVLHDENELGVRIQIGEGESFCTPSPCYLDLITPVEELERYVIIHNEREKYYDVCWKDDDEPDGRTGRTRVRATFWYHKPPQTYSQTEALSAAEAECARLNAEHRKEQS